MNWVVWLIELPSHQFANTHVRYVHAQSLPSHFLQSANVSIATGQRTEVSGRELEKILVVHSPRSFNTKDVAGIVSCYTNRSHPHRHRRVGEVRWAQSKKKTDAALTVMQIPSDGLGLENQRSRPVTPKPQSLKSPPQVDQALLDSASKLAVHRYIYFSNPGHYFFEVCSIVYAFCI